MYLQRNTEARSCNQCCNRKAISITYSEYVFIALGTKSEMHMHQIVICGLSVSFPHYQINCTIFEKRKLLSIKCVFCFLQHMSETFLIRRTERGMIKDVYWSPCKAPVILVRVLKKLEFSRQIFEKYLNIKFHENPSSRS